MLTLQPTGGAPVLPDPYGAGARTHAGRGAPVPWTLTPRMADRRARMRSIGASLFAQRGIDHVSILDVAREADVPVAPAAHGYRRRSDLIYDILYAHIDALHEYVGAADDTCTDAPPEQQVQTLVRAALDGLHEHQHAHRVLLAAFPYLPDEQRQILRYQIRTLLARLSAPLERLLPELGHDRTLMAPLVQSVAGMASHTVAWLHDDGALCRDAYARLITTAIVSAGRSLLAERAAASDVPPHT